MERLFFLESLRRKLCGFFFSLNALSLSTRIHSSYHSPWLSTCIFYHWRLFMSNVFTKNKKELAGVKVVSASEAWLKNENNSGSEYYLNPDFDFVGKVDLDISNFVLRANRDGKPTGFVEDVSNLPKRTKQELVGHFYSEKGYRNNRTVAYLIRTDSKSKTKVKPKKRGK
jgi:hypothetical protein